MTRSAIIVLGTVCGGLAIYAGIINLFGLAPKELGKTIAFVSRRVVAAAVPTLATRRLAGSSEPVKKSVSIRQVGVCFYFRSRNRLPPALGGTVTAGAVALVA